jgi:acylphosphatase
MAERIVQMRVRVSGRVQGVSYRASARKQALALSLRGWVRNLEDGRVEAVFNGPQRSVEAMVAWCHRGPLRAAVDGVEVAPMALEAFEGFDVRYT